jgi:hypothetical protein
MSSRQKVIDYVQGKFSAWPRFRDALVQMFGACHADGRLVELWQGAYQQYDPEIQFTNAPDVASGANYDYASNVIKIKLGNDPLALADMFIFESFNCVHKADYLKLRSEFNQFVWPPMLFLDYGKEMARIEGIVTFKYLETLREIEKNQPAFPFPYDARRTLKDNGHCGHEAQVIARMTWTPHNPSGTGDWRFPSPEHYAFQRMLDLKWSQAETRIIYLVCQAAGTSKGNYAKLDPNRKFLKWGCGNWPHRAEQRPTTFITLCQAANDAFKNTPQIRWRPITLANYQFTTAMELEARRLLKRAPLGKFVR